MKGFIASNVMRTGRALVALVLATLAFVWLLGMWGGLPPAEARGPAMDTTVGDELRLSTTSMMTIYLPILFKSDLVFFDDFSSTSSGWPHRVSFENCYFEYRDGRYRVQLTKNGQSCIIPNFRIPRQFNGTFKVKVRRISDANVLRYGFIFDAGTDATDETGDRWSLEVYPKSDPQCQNEGFFWLLAQKSETDIRFRNYQQSPDDHECISFIKTGKSDWNELAVVRNGGNIKVYIKNQSAYQLVGNYNNVPQLDSQEQVKFGYFLLYVISASSGTVTVEYDDLEILRGTGAP